MAVTNITELCFQECVSTQYALYTTEEKACTKACVENYFQGYQEIAFHTARELAE